MSSNGLDREFCKAHESKELLKDLEAHMETQTKFLDAQTKWVNSYIERTMPIKSHFLILIGSLSILASFAAALKILDVVLK